MHVNITNSSYTPGIYLLNDPKYGLSNLKSQDKIRIQKDFARFLSVIIRRMLKASIEDQRYKGRWTPLSAGYVEFKNKYGLSDKIWEATGTLVDSISYYKHGNQYIIGINPSKKYKNGVSILYVAKCMEYGTKNMPARPLFTPVFNYVKRYIRQYWEMYLSAPHKYSGTRIHQLNKKDR